MSLQSSMNSSKPIRTVARQLRLSSKQQDTNLENLHSKLFRNMFEHSQFNPSLSTQQSNKVLQLLMKQKLDPTGDVNQLIMKHGLLNITKQQREKAKSKEIALQNEKRGSIFSRSKSPGGGGGSSSPTHHKKRDSVTNLRKIFTDFVEDIQNSTDKQSNQKIQARQSQIKKAIDSQLQKFVRQKKENQIECEIQQKYGQQKLKVGATERVKKKYSAYKLKQAGGNVSVLNQMPIKHTTSLINGPSSIRSRVSYIDKLNEHGKKEVTINIVKADASPAEKLTRFLSKKRIPTPYQDQDVEDEEDELFQTLNRQNHNMQITQQEEDQDNLYENNKQMKDERNVHVDTSFGVGSQNYFYNEPHKKSPKISAEYLPPPEIQHLRRDVKKIYSSPLKNSYSQKRSLGPYTRQAYEQQKQNNQRPATSGVIIKRQKSNSMSGNTLSRFKLYSRQVPRKKSLFSKSSTTQKSINIEHFQTNQSILQAFNQSLYSQITRGVPQSTSGFHFSSKQNPRRHGQSFLLKGLQQKKGFKQNFLQVSNIIQKCDLSMDSKFDKKYQQDVIEDKAEILGSHANNMAEAVKFYLDMSHLNQKEQENMVIKNLVKEKLLDAGKNRQNFTSKKIIDKHKADSERCTLFLSHLGKKKLWKPDKFAMSRKVRVAQTFDDLQHQ